MADYAVLSRSWGDRVDRVDRVDRAELAGLGNNQNWRFR